MTMFATRPPAGPPGTRDLHLVRATRRAFTGPARFLADPANRARVSEYLTDMATAYGRAMRPGLTGQSYGEMAAALIGPVVSADEPVDLLVLAFAMHDLWPGRQTAAYLSHITPGAPMAFAVCDQGSAAAFSGLRIIGEYAVRRALLIVVEQAALPYDSPVTPPAEHRGVAMLFGAGTPAARVAGVRQHAAVPPGHAAGLAAAALADLAAGHPDVSLVLSDALAAAWTAPAAKRVRAMPSGQPSTAVWWGLIDELDCPPGLIVAADYDPVLRYLSLTAFITT